MPKSATVAVPASILICTNRRFAPTAVSCAERGSESLKSELERRLTARFPSVPVQSILCFGRCAEGPNVRIAPGGPFFRGVRESDLDAIVEALDAFLDERGPGNAG